MSFDQVKYELTNLYSSYINNSNMINNAVGPYIEHFSIYGFPRPNAEFDRQFLLSPDMPQELKQLGFLPSELYDVISKFDLGPQFLNDNEKNLRRKYLKMLKVYMNIQYKNFMAGVTPESIKFLQMVGDENSVKLLNNVENMRAGKNFLFRIIDLLLQEMDPIKCQDCDAKSKVTALAKVNACNMEECAKRYHMAIRNKRNFNTRVVKECNGCTPLSYNASNDTFSTDGQVWYPISQSDLDRLRGSSK